MRALIMTSRKRKVMSIAKEEESKMVKMIKMKTTTMKTKKMKTTR